MGATLSKLWSSIRNALAGGGGAHAGNSRPQHQNSSHAAKDLESGADTPSKSIQTAMSEVKKYEITEPWLRLNCSLGEGPFWEKDTNSLRFLDIVTQQIHRVDLNAGPESHRVVKKYDFSIGCTADIEGNPDEFIFGGKYGYGVANKQTGEYRLIKKVWSEDETKEGKPEKFRSNDGAVDSQGRYWVGYMFDPIYSDWREDGAVWRLNTDLSLDRPLSDITIPNGTVWDQKDTVMYFADSPSKTIFRFDYDPASGAITNRQSWFTMPEDNRYGKDAVPDGHCLDEEGYMWTALHGGRHVLRISPAGEVVAEIKVPTANPTCPCFCGDALYITSAGGTDGPDGGPLDEFAGAVFKVNVGVRGLSRNKFRGADQIQALTTNGEVVA